MTPARGRQNPLNHPNAIRYGPAEVQAGRGQENSLECSDLDDEYTLVASPKADSIMKHRYARPRIRTSRLLGEKLESRRMLAADGIALVDDSLEVSQNDGPIAIDVLANDRFDNDYAGDRRITAVSTGSLGGQIDWDARSLTYAPPANTTGLESFRYQVDGIAWAEVDVRITTPLPDFHVTLRQFRDDYPLELLSSTSFSADYQGLRQITTVSDTVSGASLTVSNDRQSVVYHRRVGFEGTDRFTYIVDDRFVATAVIDVVNPVRPDLFEVLVHSGVTNLDLLANDFPSTPSDPTSRLDPGVDWERYRRHARITHVFEDDERFDLQIVEDGRSVDFTLQPDTFGYASFRYVVDGQFEQHVSVYLQDPVNADWLEADLNGGEHALDVLSNDRYWSPITRSDVDVVQRVSSVTQGDQGGRLEVSPDGLRVLYTPAPDFTGVEMFSYVADERYTATVRVSVTNPVRDDTLEAIRGRESTLAVLDNDFLGQAYDQRLISAVSDSQLGATIRTDGNFIYYTAPETDASNPGSGAAWDEFQYTVNDEFVATARVRLKSQATNDWFSIDRAGQHSFDVLRNDHFALDEPGVRITGVSQPSAGGTAEVSSDGKRVIYSPGPTSEFFTYTVNGSTTARVDVSMIPRLRADWLVAEQNGPGVVLDLLANDFDESTYVLREYGPYLGERRLTSVSPSEHGGLVEMIDERQVRYTPPSDFVGQDAFSYVVDGYLRSEVFVDVFRRASDDVVRVDRDSEQQILEVLANDILGADYTLSGTISEVTDSSVGATVSIASDGRSLIYTPPPGFHGEDSLVYTIDGLSKATVLVSVQAPERGNAAPFFRRGVGRVPPATFPRPLRRAVWEARLPVDSFRVRGNFDCRSGPQRLFRNQRASLGR